MCKREATLPLEQQQEIYKGWILSGSSLDTIATCFKVKKSTIQKIITKGLKDKWHTAQQQ